MLGLSPRSGAGQLTAEEMREVQRVANSRIEALTILAGDFGLPGGSFSFTSLSPLRRGPGTDTSLHVAGPGARFWYLSGCAMTGRKDEAVTGLAELVRQPTGIPLIDIRTSPAFLPLRGDPRFQAILKDPKSRAQLF